MKDTLSLHACSSVYQQSRNEKGWALVRDKEVARKMTMFMQVTTIGVSKDSQLRAAKILEFVADDCQDDGNDVVDTDETFFGQGRKVIAKRWGKLKEAVKGRDVFIVTKHPQQYCNFSGKYFQPVPAFGWLTCKEGCNAMALMRAHNVLTRGGETFGVSSRYTRISMIGHEDEFDRFVERVSGIRSDDEGFVDVNGVKRNGNGNGHVNNGRANGHGNGLK